MVPQHSAVDAHRENRNVLQQRPSLHPPPTQWHGLAGQVAPFGTRQLPPIPAQPLSAQTAPGQHGVATPKQTAPTSRQVHALGSHAWVSGPTQAAPPHVGGGFVQVRVCLQTVPSEKQGLQSVHPPASGGQTGSQPSPVGFGT
jgi:hypothetical protein